MNRFSASVPLGLERLAMTVTLIAVLIFAWLAGPIRWIFIISGVGVLAYIPTLSMLALIAWREVRDVCLGHWSWVRFILAWAIVSAYIAGLLQVPSLVQVTFGLYVLTPFLFGLIVAPIVIDHWQKHIKFAVFLWALVMVGVVADSFNLDFPWVGLSYSVGDVEVETSREWHAGSSRRLSGFSRASFDAAAQILMGLMILLAAPTHLVIRILLIVLSAYGIVLTTAKGMLLVLAVATPVMLCPKPFFQLLMRSTLCFIAGLGILLPTASLLDEWHFEMKTELAHLLLFSFEDRLQNMWPEAFQLVADSGNLFLGRGFGGLGVAQTYFEPHRFNAADNLFVYTYVIFGTVGVALLLWLICRLFRVQWRCEPNDRLLAGLTLLIFVYGLTTNVFEAQMLALTLGVVARIAFDDRLTGIDPAPAPPSNIALSPEAPMRPNYEKS